MSMTTFLTLYPELAEAETRTLTAVSHPELPPDRYAFVESYCDARGCDCRRVLFNVIAMGTGRHVATIAHALDEAKPRYGLPRTFLDTTNTQTSCPSPCCTSSSIRSSPTPSTRPGCCGTTRCSRPS